MPSKLDIKNCNENKHSCCPDLLTTQIHKKVYPLLLKNEAPFQEVIPIKKIKISKTGVNISVFHS